jgi:hypothetical protein
MTDHVIGPERQRRRHAQGRQPVFALRRLEASAARGAAILDAEHAGMAPVPRAEKSRPPLDIQSMVTGITRASFRSPACRPRHCASATVQPTSRAARLDQDREILDRVPGGVIAQIPLAAILAIEPHVGPRNWFRAHRLWPAYCGSGSVMTARLGEKLSRPPSAMRPSGDGRSVTVARAAGRSGGSDRTGPDNTHVLGERGAAHRLRLQAQVRMGHVLLA